MIKLIRVVVCLFAVTLAGAQVPPQPRAWLGVGLSLHRSVDGEIFLHVQNVAAKGPGANAGLQPMDIIIKLNGKKLTFRSEVEFLRFVATLEPGRALELQIRRADKSLKTKLIPGELTPAAREAWMATYRAAEAKAARSSPTQQQP